MSTQDASIIKECIAHLHQVQQALDNSAESIQENINIAENMMRVLTNTKLPLEEDRDWDEDGVGSAEPR